MDLNFLPGSASLAEATDRRVLVLLRDGRGLRGVLRSFDHFGNVVVEQTAERLFVTRDELDLVADQEAWTAALEEAEEGSDAAAAAAAADDKKQDDGDDADDASAATETATATTTTASGGDGADGATAGEDVGAAAAATAAAAAPAGIYSERMLGLYLVRGDNVTLIAEAANELVPRVDRRHLHQELAQVERDTLHAAGFVRVPWYAVHGLRSRIDERRRIEVLNRARTAEGAIRTDSVPLLVNPLALE